MHVINARNVHQALPEAIRYLTMNGIQRDSRNGAVLVAPGPVATVYSRPKERVEAWPLRDANPTFHLMEALWMLGGRHDVAFPKFFNSTFGQFSDDGIRFNGAYGFRWRHYFGHDQLVKIADALKFKPDCRRQVLAMWDGERDLGSGSKDIPCNTHAYFTRDADGRLDMTVCCRSNDIIWGCYGANAVHFSLLQEFMAGAIGCQVGTYTHFSNNWHAYLKTLDPLRPLAEKAAFGERADRVAWDPYVDEFDGSAAMVPVLGEGESPESFMSDLHMFLSGHGSALGVKSKFIRKVAIPLMTAYVAFKDKGNPDRYSEAIKIVREQCAAQDWAMAASSWYFRRLEKSKKQNND